jgi:hypothetical protein
MNKSAFIKQAGAGTALMQMRQATGRVVGSAPLRHGMWGTAKNFVQQNAHKAAVPAALAGGAMLGNHHGYGKGYDTGQQSGYGLGQNVGKQVGYQLAQGQAQNTGFMGRLMGNYDFDPSALQGANPTPPADFFQQASAQDPNRLGHVRRMIGM